MKLRSFVDCVITFAKLPC